MKKIQKKRKGFTLIELVVVIVIIAILAAVALLSFGSFTKTARDSRIKSEHSQLITAGNMWRAAKDDPNKAPAYITDIFEYMESKKPVLGYKAGTGDDATSWVVDSEAGTVHVLTDDGKLESYLTDDASDSPSLVYDFKAK